jgi:hypothetical protein
VKWKTKGNGVQALAATKGFAPVIAVPSSYHLRLFFGRSSVATEAVPKEIRRSTEERPKKLGKIPGKKTGKACPCVLIIRPNIILPRAGFMKKRIYHFKLVPLK